MPGPDAPCMCGHSIEEHDPECTECLCIGYEADRSEPEEPGVVFD